MESLATTAQHRDNAFRSYAFMKSGNAPAAYSLAAELLAAGDKSAPDEAFALWAAGEYMNATQDYSLLQNDGTAIAKAIGRIEGGWRTPQSHWLDPRRSGVFLTNLAIYYAGLSSIGPHAGDERTQQLMKSIRELLFARFIKDGRVVSELGDTAVHGDIVAAAIPFGLLGIEDRILIEALAVVEESLTGKGVRLSANDTWFGGCERTDVTCLLAWYYANKGEIGKAKSLLAHVEGLFRTDGSIGELDVSTAREPLFLSHWQSQSQAPDSRLSVVLFELASASVRSGGLLKAGAAADTVDLLHKPTGYDDPYVTLPYERLPREPEAGDTVFVRLLTRPFHPNQRVTVHVMADGAACAETIRMQAETTPDGDKVWAARLGVFEAGQEVRYEFRLEGDNGVQQSEPYRFLVRQWLPVDRVRSMEASDDSIAVTFAGRPEFGERSPVVTLARHETGAARLSFEAVPHGAANGAGEAAETAEAVLALAGAQLAARRENGALKLLLRNEQGVLIESYGIEGKPFLEVLTDRSGMLHKVRFNWKSKAEHRWFGMGERYSHFDYSGQEVDQYVYNQYRDQGLKTYMPVPFAVSSGKYAVFLDTPLYSKFRFHTRLSDLVEIEADLHTVSQQLTAYLFAGEPLSMIGQFAGIAGRPALPPKWAFGPWMSSNNWDSQAEVMKQVELTNRHRIPATVLVLEQWSDEATFYIFNDAQYEVKDGSEPFRYADFRFPEWGRWPNPKRMMDDLHADGLKVLLWQIPIHKFMYGVVHEQRDRDERTFLERGYCVHDENGEPFTLPYNWFKDCHIIDYTNPEAKRWWFDKRRYLVEELGVDGFKTDGGEFVFGHGLKFHDGSTGREMRNLYPNLYAGSYYDFVQQVAEGGGVTFSRAGYTGAQRYPLHWAGDERSTFEAFRSSLIAGLTSSMSGIPFWGWDLGGFHGDIPTAELFVRSTQMAAFCPVMQYHAETKGEFNQDRTPWNIAERTGQPAVIELYKRYADIRMNLLPYIYEQAVRTSRTGVPLMRAMLLEHSDDPHCTEMTGQYMFGDSLLVAPIVEEGAYTKEIYFPEGRWLPLFGGEEIAGPRLVKVEAELARIPVYVKQNSVLALNLGQDCRLGDHVGNRTDRYERLCFLVYLTDTAAAHFEDDLGLSIGIGAERDADGIRLKWNGNRTEPAVFIVGGLDGVSSVQAGSLSFERVGEASLLSAGTYCVRDGEVLVAVGEAGGEITIHP
ncbi:TIM-barrel domain-containing protein [uncultured Paenibacillus sp.]|uniref:glycoside hydrolase family 31 protein n=1 Tax=uncultured Paenibacillus sp. TaxID=227322 RepID=UPI0028D28984|nr:TIM-barrel domain-containing protein [uncultured Paenibacillus sp.]